MPQVEPARIKERAAELRAALGTQRANWLAAQVGRPLRVLAERDGTGHAEDFAPVRLPAGAAPGALLTITPTRIEEGMLA